MPQPAMENELTNLDLLYQAWKAGPTELRFGALLAALIECAKRDAQCEFNLSEETSDDIASKVRECVITKINDGTYQGRRPLSELTRKVVKGKVVEFLEAAKEARRTQQSSPKSEPAANEIGTPHMVAEAAMWIRWRDKLDQAGKSLSRHPNVALVLEARLTYAVLSPASTWDWFEETKRDYVKHQTGLTYEQQRQAKDVIERKLLKLAIDAPEYRDIYLALFPNGGSVSGPRGD
ncbi:MAG: hypothetical protein JWQ90_3414 [Hydrocarboniphaga sp.]|uniref:hypothetical protein n=1 Tax=Hydrocarboniphaga sp. TaxID=2033016 RepID=UPI002603786B|nr:hypothetical protein [Hydrocarboniphaga sp.]MDB5970964.1 hypothetical protein [Hydrocarboniphaga sp.]